jgi:hypothetical protein
MKQTVAIEHVFNHLQFYSMLAGRLSGIFSGVPLIDKSQFDGFPRLRMDS